MTDPRRARGVVFDLFGTLTDASVERRRTAFLHEQAALVGADPDRYERAARASFHERVRGRFPDVRTTVEWLASVSGALPADRQVTAAVDLRLEHELELLRARSSAVFVMERLAEANVPMTVLSDTGPETGAVWHRTSFSSFVGDPILSCHVRMTKPDARLYAMATDRLGVASDQCLYVGDGGSGELTGATQAGLHAVLIRQSSLGIGEDYRVDVDDWHGGEIPDLPSVLDLTLR